MDGPAEYGNKIYTVTVSTGSSNRDVSFSISSNQQPPQKIRFFNGSITIAAFKYIKKLDKYVELMEDEFERFDRGFRTGQCRHQSQDVSRENGDERFHKRLAKLQKKLKEKKKNENDCSYCEEYGDVISIEMPEQVASEAMTGMFNIQGV